MSNEVKVESTGFTGSMLGRLSKVTEKDVLKGLAVVLLTAILSAASQMVRLGQRVPDQGASGLSYLIVAIPLVATLLSWVVSTLIVHGVSMLLDGKGSLKRMLTLSGVAYTAYLIQAVLNLADAFLTTTATQSATTAGSGIVGTLMNQFNLFSVLSLVLVAMVVMVNYGLSWKRAAIAALVPVLAWAILSVALSYLGLRVGGLRFPFQGNPAG